MSIESGVLVDEEGVWIFIPEFGWHLEGIPFPNNDPRK